MKRIHIRSKRKLRLNVKIKKAFVSILQWLLLILVAAIVGYSFVVMGFQTVHVVGPSMSPTLKDEQVVLVNKIDMTIHGINRFDIVAFSRVEGDDYYDIKRVIGLPGETVRISDGDVYIDNVRLTGMPFNDKILLSGAVSEDIKLGGNEYFVLGDNVNNSEDSRYTNVGMVNKSEIIGKVDRIISPKSDKKKLNK